LKVSTNVKIAMQCFENFGEANAPNAPPWLRACHRLLYFHSPYCEDMVDMTIIIIAHGVFNFRPRYLFYFIHNAIWKEERGFLLAESFATVAWREFALCTNIRAVAWKTAGSCSDECRVCFANASAV